MDTESKQLEIIRSVWNIGIQTALKNIMHWPYKEWGGITYIQKRKTAYLVHIIWTSTAKLLKMIIEGKSFCYVNLILSYGCENQTQSKHLGMIRSVWNEVIQTAPENIIDWPYKEWGGIKRRMDREKELITYIQKKTACLIHTIRTSKAKLLKMIVEGKTFCCACDLLTATYA